MIDQFEELFTLADAPQRLQFDALLAGALADADCPLFVISTVRADFLDRIELLPRLAALYNQRCKRYLLPIITPEGLREAIELPARRAGLDASEITAAMLAEARDEPGALPLVENALLQLWQQRQGKQLSGAEFHARGGLAGMLSASADALLDRIERDLKPAGRAGALELLLRLTHINADGRHSRQRVNWAEAVQVAGLGDAVRGEQVLLRLSGQRPDDAPRSLSGLGIVGCETASTVHFSPAFCPIAGLWACKSGKNCPRCGRFSLSTPQVRQAPSTAHAGSLRLVTSGVEGDQPYVDLIHETLVRPRSGAAAPGQPLKGHWPTLYRYIDANRDRDVLRQQLGGSGSYRARLGKHRSAELRRQVCGREQIDRHAQQLFKFGMQAAQVKQGRAWECVHQQIEITAVAVSAMQHRPEDPKVRGAETACHFAHCGALQIHGGGWLQGWLPHQDQNSSWGARLRAGQALSPAAASPAPSAPGWQSPGRPPRPAPPPTTPPAIHRRC